MRVIHGLALSTKENLQLCVERGVDDEVEFDVEGENFNADFVLPRRQCRELRDWLNIVLDD